jgi:ARG and Rhodanese-Phosphatase-superfamily-associated Protein domain
MQLFKVNLHAWPRVFEIDSNFEDYKEKISKVPSQVGFIAFVNGDFAGLDIVGDPELFSAIHESLINSYLMDAMYNPKAKKKKVEPKKLAMGILDEATKASTKKGKKIGAEKREELKGKNTVGEFVRFNGKPVHLALFPDAKTEDVRIV